MPAFGRDPEAFIRHNLLTLHPDLDDPPQRMLFQDGTVRVRLEDITTSYQTVQRNRNRRGLARLMPHTNTAWWHTTARIYRVTPAFPSDDDAFPAYVCPYRDNDMKSKMLGDDADVMFTGDMDGCTFGVGMANAQGGVRVGHVNAQNLATGSTFQPDFTAQRAAQTNALTNAGLSRGMVEPSAYRDGAPLGTEFKAITIGLRVNRNWRFFYQHHWTDGPGGDRVKLATVRIA